MILQLLTLTWLVVAVAIILMRRRRAKLPQVPEVPAKSYCPRCGEYVLNGVCQQRPLDGAEIKVCLDCERDRRPVAQDAIIGTRWCNWTHTHAEPKMLGYVWGPADLPAKYGFMKSHGMCEGCARVEMERAEQG
jgi:hypothetical protein